MARSHLDALAATGYAAQSVAWRLLFADTIGQSFVYFLTDGGFVADQLRFARSVLHQGLLGALRETVAEIEGCALADVDVDRRLKKVVETR